MTSVEKRILIVDDDRDFVEAIASFLGAHGFTVLKAYNGRDGVKLARMERPDLILMDIMMDERTEGFFTIQEMRRQEDLKGVPIFVLSSLNAQMPDFGNPPDSAWLAYDEFLSKPVDMAQLVEKIRQRIGQPA
ncbi:MAG: response regulator [Acidobacteriia bacterium]|nr:response regulator [Terriglobia bacterium]